MIQVCSRCGTRWNVRDRQRVWCARCQGPLLPPSTTPEQQWTPQQSSAERPGVPRRLPPGYRWIAVRPGAAPPPRRAQRPLGPTPRYASIPRWGLQDHVEPVQQTEAAEAPKASARMVRITLLVALILFAVAVVVHIADYALLLFNRTTLLNPIVAGVATWAGVTASVLAFFSLIAGFVVLTNWLIARRAGAYARLDSEDPRPAWELWLGCLLPFANLFWAPVFVLELARVEGRLTWLRTSIVVWWCAWWVSFLLSVFAFATSFTTDAQGIADNTVATVIAYLAGLATLLLTLRMYRGFEHTAVDKPVKRWVIAPDSLPAQEPDTHAPDAQAPDTQDADAHASDAQDPDAETAARVEAERDDPAA